MAPTNLINLEQCSVSFGIRQVLDNVSLGVNAGDRIGVVGLNGGGKTTLLEILTGVAEPDSGRVTRTGRVSIGYLIQTDDVPPGTTVRSVIVDGQPDHVWAADAGTRAVVEHLLAARSAATADPRYRPLTPADLRDFRVTVTIIERLDN